MKVDRIGDFVLATGAIHALLKHFGRSECSLIVSEEARAFAEREFPGVSCQVVPTFKQRLFREIAREHRSWTAPLALSDCENLVCLRHQRSLYRDLILRAIPCQRLWWLDQAPFGDAPCLRLDPSECSYSEATNDPFVPRELSAHQLLISRVLSHAVDAQILRPRVSESATVVPTHSIVITPIAGESIRNLPATLIWGALNKSPKAQHASFLLSGRPDQTEQLIAFRETAPPNFQATTRIETLNCMETWIAHLQHSRLVITADSASAHLAAAFDRPMVAIAGGGHPGMFTPRFGTQRQRWFTHPVPCEGCDWQCMHPTPLCITQNSASDLASAIDDLLVETQSAP